MTENPILKIVNRTLLELDHNIILKLREWGKVVQLVIDEIDYFIDFKQNQLVLKQETIQTFNFKLTSSSTVFLQIIQKELDPVDAVVSGEVAIEGSLTDALEFSEILLNS